MAKTIAIGKFVSVACDLLSSADEATMLKIAIILATVLWGIATLVVLTWNLLAARESEPKRKMKTNAKSKKNGHKRNAMCQLDSLPEELTLCKVNPELGWKISKHLKKLGLETPMITSKSKDFVGPDAQIDEIKGKFREIMQCLGLDLTNDSLSDSPKRVARMFVTEMFWGLRPEYFPKCTAVANEIKYDEMVVEKNIGVDSYCEHHFVPIEGHAHVAYIPASKVLGLSKLNRIVRYFSRRPQIQERLTKQIQSALQYILETQDVAVSIVATHHCVRSRGVRDGASLTVTSQLGGRIKKDPRTRQEFLCVTKEC
mmetsp:Transcript_10956/g.20128  ORF Transcript_10956/g.20128 Transcript_10956/m.20128 type:complete len:314 (+) Transcript_10956:124-1065(+)|eukprot:CAMPEP_0197536210 /NCGR_PEP_ID=MMETSP1318-20131121/53301_1 /TAXON_ID=552666 /ORGANISM="Partenskyella glossopodia, Strain RCC365" /LENGTH=313 /DNA_ID=CAMNT_0043094043 /DNA_START=20 /DNA_END=961 /DNA_ORIENTATION=-